MSGAFNNYGQDQPPHEDAECECEHTYDEHARVDGGTFCQHVMDSGAQCSCPSFEEAG